MARVMCKYVVILYRLNVLGLYVVEKGGCELEDDWMFCEFLLRTYSGNTFTTKQSLSNQFFFFWPHVFKSVFSAIGSLAGYARSVG